MKLTRFLSIGLALALLGGQAFSWNDRGHEVVAAIAWARLGHAAKVAIANILLKGDTVTITSKKTGKVTTLNFVPAKPGSDGMTNDYLDKVVQPMFIKAATWPDKIKGGVSKKFEKSINYLNRKSPQVNQASERERVRCKTWHYLDLPIVNDGDTTDHSYIASNADYAINACVAELNRQEAKAKPSRKREALFLYFLVHIVGDVHQPLHCASSYKILADGDDGGNKFPLDNKPKTRNELHAYWDSGVDHAIKLDGRFNRASASAVALTWLGDAADQPSHADYTDLEPMHWIQHGHDLAVSDVYTIPEKNSPTKAYTKNQADICKKQVLLGGYRLAELLNKALS